MALRHDSSALLMYGIGFSCTATTLVYLAADGGWLQASVARPLVHRRAKARNPARSFGRAWNQRSSALLPSCNKGAGRGWEGMVQLRRCPRSILLSRREAGQPRNNAQAFHVQLSATVASFAAVSTFAKCVEGQPLHVWPGSVALRAVSPFEYRYGPTLALGSRLNETPACPARRAAQGKQGQHMLQHCL